MRVSGFEVLRNVEMSCRNSTTLEMSGPGCFGCMTRTTGRIANAGVVHVTDSKCQD